MIRRVFAVTGVLLIAACGSSAPVAQAGAELYPAGIRHYDMPDGFPAVLTWCEAGKTRVVMSYDRVSTENRTVAISAVAEPGCSTGR